MNYKETIKSIRNTGKETDLFPILQKLFINKGYNNVEITHGKDEFGKDIVFREYDIKLKKDRWFAIVAKNKNAEMRDFETNGEINRQIKLSFECPFKDSKGNEKYISQVIVVINGTVGTQAKEIISRVLDPQYRNNVEIWNYQRLEEEVCKIRETDSTFDKQTKILFDVLTLNKDIVEIKKSFINSYIYSFLYANPKSNEDSIFQYINSQLNNSLELEKNYVAKALNDLRMKKFILSPVDNKKIYYLSDEKEKEIDTVYSDVNSKEKELKTIIDLFLNDKQIEINCLDLIDFMYKLYQENYTIDIDEIKNTNTSFSSVSLKKSYTDLLSFFKRKKVNEKNADLFAKELLKLCSENDFLNKLASIHLFNNLYSSNKLEEYINNKKQEILLDTQILIRLICVLYDPNYEFTDTALNSVKILYSTLKNFENQIEIVSTYNYLEEVANHLLEAIKLEKFFRLPFVSELGKSKNVFYNFYLELHKKDKIDEDVDFCEFVKDLLNEDIKFYSDRMFVNQVIRSLSEMFELYNISFLLHQDYSNFQEIKKDYEISLFDQKKERTITAIENDVRTILYLSTKDCTHGEPFLITWDSVFYGFRKKILDKYPPSALNFWYIYSPLKIVDRLSVMNFNLNPKSINLNIITLTETNYNYSTKTNSFLDVISQFFNNENFNQDFLKKLNKLRKNTRDVENTSPTSDDFKDDEDGGEITRLLSKIKDRYSSYESKFKFNDVIEIFEQSNFEENIISILSNAINNFSKENIESMYLNIDKLIEQSKQK